MKRVLEYFYNFKIEKCKIINNNIYFYILDDFYTIQKCSRSIEEIKEIFELINSNLYLKNLYHEIIINNKNQLITEYNNENYIVMKLKTNFSTDICLFDIIDNKISVINNNILDRTNWAKLWSDKVDYFEYQISELGLDKEIILNSFSYYIGLAENAISLVNIINDKYKKNNQIVISHKRINIPNLSINFYDPLNIILDIKVRDIAEYIKSYYFYYNENEIYKFLNKLNLDDYDANMLFARILYPSYYFDIYEKVIEEKLEETELIDIIKKVHDYEFFLRDIWLILNKKYNMERIEWIINKKES